ncbi:MAG: EscU/YscU/HrcU family type III secretion system export apparatus switch protein [Polyangia bacterium]
MAERASAAKTEEPTPQRLAEARRRGSVAVSRDLLSGVTGLALCVALVLGGRAWIGGLVAYLRMALDDATSNPSLASAGWAALSAVRDGLLWPLAIAVVAGLVVGLTQTRGLFSTYPLKCDFTRAMPSARRLLGTAALSEITKNLFKAAVVAVLAWWTLAPVFSDVAHLAGRPAGSALALFGFLGARLGLRLAVGTAVLGVADYWWQRHRHGKSLRMSHEEVRREQKEREGDPLHKLERQRLHREILEQQMIDDVRRAKLVVVDGDRIAVALGYDPDLADAPVIVAKGERLVAGTIRDVAREAGVPLWTDVALAQALRVVEPGDEIPESAFEAVAQLLARVDRS